MPSKGDAMQFVNGPTSQVFGANKQFPWQLGYGHLGKDWAVVIGTGCTAIAPGVVVWADWGHKMPKALCDAYMMVHGSPASGIVVIIQHDGWYSMYAHLSETHLYSKSAFHKASVVNRGTIIGKSGTTGNSTGPHVHGETFTVPCSPYPPFGRYNPDLQIAHENAEAAKAAARAVAAAAAKPKAGPMQRLVAAGGVNELDRPTTHGAKVLRTFKAGSVLNFKGYVIGQRLKGMNGWFVGISGGYFHISHFTQRDVAGLPNLIRTTGGAKSARRSTPQLKGKLLSYLRPHTAYVIEAYTIGDTWHGSNIWFKVQGSAGWTHSKLFTSQSLTGLKKL